MNKKLLIIPLIALILLTAIPFGFSQTDTSIINMSGAGWTLKVDASIQTAEILSPIQVTSKSSTEKELSIIINDIKEVPEFTAKFKVDTTGLTLYKQPPLTQELNASNYDLLNATHAIKNGITQVHRPENVLNSYACFDQTGKKVAHIYGSKLIDAKDNYIWVDQELKDGLLTVMLDSKWMENASYPVTLDPTFGYMDIGASNAYNQNQTYANPVSIPVNCTVNNITAYIDSYSTDVNYGIYHLNGTLAFKSILDNNVDQASPAWLTITIDENITSGGYLFGLYIENGHAYYDTTTLTFTIDEGQFPDPYEGTGPTLGTISIYANYTEIISEETPTPTPTATAQPATTTTNIFFSLMIFAIICLNLAVGYLSKGFIVPATIGIISISIAIATLFTTVYAEIVFSPWLQLMLLCLALFNEFQVIRKVRD